MQHTVKVAGEGSGLAVTTMHDVGVTFDATLLDGEILATGGAGVNFAIVDDNVGVETAMRAHGQSVSPGLHHRSLRPFLHRLAGLGGHRPRHEKG